MDRSEYRSLLGRLPIKSPTPADMAMLCPHLTTDEAVEAFTTNDGYVAVPPTRIRYGFLVIHYIKEWVEEGWGVTGTKNHPAMLVWAFAARTQRSYTDGKSHGDVFTESKYMERAMRFAEGNWGDELILDDWACFTHFYVQDPTDLVVDAYHFGDPRTKAVLGVAFARDLNNIVNDLTKPQSELFDEAIARMALDPIEYAELKGGRGVYTVYNCAHCGAGLSLSICNGCGHSYHDNKIRSGWNTPLTRKMVEYLRESGHTFGIDPQIEWEKEREHWTVAREAYER